MARRARRRDPLRERRWRRLLARHERSGLSVRAYCRERGITETSFYGWRREIRRRDREAPLGIGDLGHPRAARARFVPVHVVPSRRVRGDAGIDAARLASDGQARPGDVGLTILLARGRAVRVARDFDGATLTRLLTVLEGAPC